MHYWKSLFAGLGLAALAASAFGASADLRNAIEIFRTDLSSAKKDAISETLKLTEAEAKVFWPVYREYEAELVKLGDERLALIEQFGKAHFAGTLDDAAATQISKSWFGLEQRRLDLWKKYHARLSKALSPVRAAQFVQVEHQVALLIDLDIMSEMPIIKPPAKP